MARQPPTQELVAKDLHATEWRFRHIFRGQPRRHLLQSGWSVFVSSKRLVAGDAFIFLRGENGELRVGVRRAMRQQINVPSSVISSHSMHLGVLATAWHAVSTGTMFTVFYKPRTSPSEFIVPFDQYMDSLKNNHSIGMRFKMRFEGEEAPEQRFTGTIVGIGDVEPNRWPGSKWRNLKVRWDETSSIPRPERVSPWKIEPALTPPVTNPLPMHRHKRPRAMPPSPDSSVLTREGSSKVTVDPSQAHGIGGYSRVLQGQELPTLRSNLADSNESDAAQKSVMWPPCHDEDKIDVSGQRRFGQENRMPLMRHERTNMDTLSGFRPPSDFHGFGSSTADQTTDEFSHLKGHFLDQDGGLNLLGGPWSMMPPNPSLNVRESSLKAPPQANEMSFHKSGSFRFGGLNNYSSLQGFGVEQHPTNWLTPLLPQSRLDNPLHLRVMKPQPSVLHAPPPQSENIKPKGTGNCKIFGIHLDSSPVVTETTTSHTNAAHESELHMQPEAVQRSEQLNGSKSADAAAPVNEQEKCLQLCPPVPKEALSKNQGSSTRSCTKVHKQGIALGRSVDLTKFNNYDELIAELDQMFEFGGELMAPIRNWLVVYTDNEGDMMLVGDDHWHDFCRVVRKIFIYTREEVQKFNPGTLNPRAFDKPAIEEKTTSKESKCLLHED
ncbi:Auxin response factor 24 [Acorus gramineus]|uniref:Auxin response factor n=1 Tax=Acorus gramineus TaxID=55184 RepID=A0AAV9B6A9_ACOGR|nr:Auxin response factor 24 [Acorus gramineus]